MKRPALFLDRDGVLVKDVSPLTRREQVELLPGAAEAVARAQRAGLAIVVVSNQALVARGLLGEDQVAEINAWIEDLLRRGGCAPLDAFHFCPHHPHADLPEYRKECDCRKPRPGMILSAARALALDLERSYLIGDRPSDVLAGARAGCRTALVTGSGRHASPPIVGMEGAEEARPDIRAESLLAAVEKILG